MGLKGLKGLMGLRGLRGLKGLKGVLSSSLGEIPVFMFFKNPYF
jgi:hypothetical protein